MDSHPISSTRYDAAGPSRSPLPNHHPFSHLSGASADNYDPETHMTQVSATVQHMSSHTPAYLQAVQRERQIQTYELLQSRLAAGRLQRKGMTPGASAEILPNGSHRDSSSSIIEDNLHKPSGDEPPTITYRLSEYDQAELDKPHV